jgi:GST-like protein
MIELYTFGTPNGRKVPIMLEEVGLAYSVHPVNLGANEQFDPKFLAISPNNKIPAIVDTEAAGGRLTLFESGAILIYLAEKTGKLLAPSGAARYEALEWLNWQTGGLAPMLGQLGFYAIRSE